MNHLSEQHYKLMKQNEVHNLAVLVLDVETRKVLAYIGNSPTNAKHHKDVNNVIAPRSTGSTLKPFLYAHMLQSGDLLPTQLVKDVPTDIAGYIPKNFDLKYDGAVPANEALTRSLNIPAVRLLRKYGLQKFLADLKDYNIKDINKSADYYGLSLVLGGGEASLWDLCKVFAGYAGTINHYESSKHNYYTNEFQEPSYELNSKVNFGKVTSESNYIDAGSAYLTFNTLTEVNRPLLDQAWKYYDSSQKIAWKTGTSFGFRDAWAIGTTEDYVVGVWVGNADGEGRPGLVGVQTAAPILFDVFDILPKSNWFVKPYDEMLEVSICKKSGYRASSICDDIELKYIQASGQKTEPCPFHQLVHLDNSERYQVNSSCEAVSDINTKPWFKLPPLQAYYFQNKNPFYKPLPPYRNDCLETAGVTMEFIYPNQQSIVFLPKDFDGNTNDLILKVAHSRPELELYWYIDNQFIGITKDIHDMAVLPSEGDHIITVVDVLGNELKHKITISE